MGLAKGALLGAWGFFLIGPPGAALGGIAGLMMDDKELEEKRGREYKSTRHRRDSSASFRSFKDPYFGRSTPSILSRPVERNNVYGNYERSNRY